MNPSNYRQVLKVIKRDNAGDMQGFEEEIYTECFKFRAYVNKLSGKEYWEAKQLKAEETLKVYTYYSSIWNDINTKDYFIEFNNEVYDIQDIDNIMFNNKEIQLKIKKRG